MLGTSVGPFHVQNRDTLTLAVPVVFLVLPVTVLFAVYPGFAFLSFRM